MIHVFQSTSLATRAQGPHPFPFRTRALRPAAPMVLRPRGRGRVGRRRHPFKKGVTLHCVAPFLFCREKILVLKSVSVESHAVAETRRRTQSFSIGNCLDFC